MSKYSWIEQVQSDRSVTVRLPSAGEVAPAHVHLGCGHFFHSPGDNIILMYPGQPAGALTNGIPCVNDIPCSANPTGMSVAVLKGTLLKPIPVSPKPMANPNHLPCKSRWCEQCKTLQSCMASIRTSAACVFSRCVRLQALLAVNACIAPLAPLARVSCLG